MGIKVRHRGGYENTVKSLKKMSSKSDLMAIFNKYGRRGVEILAEGTPKKTGRTAASWKYEISSEDGKTTLVFYNTNTNKGVNIAVILQTGHGTRGGGYVQGIDYINPASAEIFEAMCEELWAEVRSR